MSRRASNRAAAWLLCCLPLAACATTNPHLGARLSSPDDIYVFDQPVRVHMTNGDIVSFARGVSVQLDSIVGDGVRSNVTLSVAEPVTAVARADVELVQSFHGVAARGSSLSGGLEIASIFVGLPFLIFVLVGGCCA